MGMVFISCWGNMWMRDSNSIGNTVHNFNLSIAKPTPLPPPTPIFGSTRTKSATSPHPHTRMHCLSEYLKLCWDMLISIDTNVHLWEKMQMMQIVFIFMTFPHMHLSKPTLVFNTRISLTHWEDKFTLSAL